MKETLEMLEKKLEHADNAAENVMNGENISSFQFQSIFWENTVSAVDPETEGFLSNLVEVVCSKIGDVVSIQGVSDEYPEIYCLTPIKDKDGFVIEIALQSLKVDPQEEMMFVVGDLDICDHEGDLQDAFYSNLEDAIFQRIMRRISLKAEAFARNKDEIHEWSQKPSSGTSWMEHKLSLGELLRTITGKFQAQKSIILAKSKKAMRVVESLPAFIQGSNQSRLDGNHVVEIQDEKDMYLVIGEEKSTYEASCIFAPHSLSIRDGKLYLKYDVVVLEAAVVDIV